MDAACAPRARYGRPSSRLLLVRFFLGWPRVGRQGLPILARRFRIDGFQHRRERPELIEGAYGFVEIATQKVRCDWPPLPLCLEPPLHRPLARLNLGEVPELPVRHEVAHLEARLHPPENSTMLLGNPKPTSDLLDQLELLARRQGLDDPYSEGPEIGPVEIVNHEVFQQIFDVNALANDLAAELVQDSPLLKRFRIEIFTGIRRGDLIGREVTRRVDVVITAGHRGIV